MLAERNLYFEGWCIEALAETLSKNRQLLPWCAPRRMPHIHVEDTQLYVPFAPTIRLPRSQALVLQACDGVRTAQEIARTITGDPASGLKSGQEVYRVLESLCETKRIVWTLEIAPEGVSPERALRRLLERIDDDCLRRTSLASLEQLENARLAVAQAAGEGDQLVDKLGFQLMEGKSIAPGRTAYQYILDQDGIYHLQMYSRRKTQTPLRNEEHSTYANFS